MIDDWVAELCTILDVPPEAVDVPALLELAKDAAHNVDRPAAPVTTFIVGYAAGMSDGRAADPITTASDLARSWPPNAEVSGRTGP